MTNTHINVGGHKITTNKVGQVHSTTTLLNGFTGLVQWVVTNGVCIVSAWGVKGTTPNTQLAVIQNVPKSKIHTCVEINNTYMYIFSDNQIILSVANTTDSNYITLTYPVVDDWVES